MCAAGVIDPAKVTRVALENAASIAGMFLTTECVIVEKKEDKPEMPMGAPGMGGMGGMAGGSQVSGVSSWKWVSDEAEQAVNEGQASSVGAANSSMGMGGMGMGMGMGQPAQGGGMKSTIGVYMKKRIIFYLLFALAMGLLFTNLFTSYGITISNWIVTKGFEFLGQ